MKLVSSIEDKFYWIHNFLPNHEYKRIHNEIFKERKKLNYQDSSKTWNSLLINNLTPPNKLKVKSLASSISKLYEGKNIKELAARGLQLDACCLGLDACRLHLESL
jgi:hypothetical protein